jgi:hypothetical protein
MDELIKTSKRVHGKIHRSPTMQDITWFIERYQNDRLNLNPAYQRRSVWTRKDKIFFLDTILNGYPCPSIYLHKTLDEKTGAATYHVVDGKQRLDTILKFANNQIQLPKDFDNKNPDLAGKKWKQIPIEYKKLFWNYILPVDQFDVVEEVNIDEIFDRLNRNSRKLDPQELRHARYDGWFIGVSEKLSEDYDKLKELKIVTTARARRMKDTQFISELLMILLKNNVNGFSQDMIDNYYALYDDLDADDIEESEELGLVKVDTEYIEHDFKKAINYIYEMNLENECVWNWATSFGNFYSLFAFVSLTNFDKLDVSTVATKYSDFMNFVNEYREKPEDSDIKDINVISYAKNSTGASTDLPRRTARLEALRNYIFN